jgi:hypothetical protein
MSLGITDKSSPNPTTLTTLTLYIRGLVDKDGKPYDLSGCSKFYCNVKSSLATVDASADVKINSVSNPTQFVTTYASTGNLDVILSTTNTALTAGTLYYIDVAAIWASGTKVELVRDTLVFDAPVTLAVS